MASKGKVETAIDNAIAKAETESKAKDKTEKTGAIGTAKNAAEAKTRKNTPAKTAAEFIEKYYRKRFSPATAGKAYLLSFLFDVYKQSDISIKTTLWDMELLKSRVEEEEDIRSFDAYYYLTEWLRILFEDSRTMRNALRSALSDFLHITSSITAAENIRSFVIDAEITDKQALSQEALFTLWLNTLTIDAYTPQNDGGTLIQSLRENIGEGLRYMKAYHAFLDVVAEVTGIPECTYLKVGMKPIRDTLSVLNEALEALRSNIAEHREQEVKAASTANNNDRVLPPASLTFWTPEYLKATMENFRPVGDEPPVPEERIDYLRGSIKRNFKKEYINWYVLWALYSASYRIPVPAATPPTGRKNEQINLRVTAQPTEVK